MLGPEQSKIIRSSGTNGGKFTNLHVSRLSYGPGQVKSIKFGSAGQAILALSQASSPSQSILHGWSRCMIILQ